MLKRRNEAPLDLPPDHPVRRLFRRFRQQREARLGADAESPRRPQVPASTGVVTVTESPTSAAANQKRNMTAAKSTEQPKARGRGGFKESVWKAESLETLPDRTKCLKKTDSCDSGITKSDLRLDDVGGARTPQERSPVRPDEERVFRPIPERSVPASLAELKRELRGGIGSVNGRVAALEAQLAEILRLLESGKSSGSFFEISRLPSPDSEKDGFS